MTENELCNKLIEEMESNGFESHPEQEGWDILFSHNKILIGVQAKIKLNLHGIRQCLDQDNTDFKVLLFSEYSEKPLEDYLIILSRLKIIPVIYNIMGDGFEVITKKKLFYYRHKPSLRPDGLQYDFGLKAGIQSPHTVRSLSINLVALELAWEENGRLPMTFYELKKAGIDKIYNKYFKWDELRHGWNFKDYNLPSKNYPHILAALQKKVTENKS